MRRIAWVITLAALAGCHDRAREEAATQAELHAQALLAASRACDESLAGERIELEGTEHSATSLDNEISTSLGLIEQAQLAHNDALAEREQASLVHWQDRQRELRARAAELQAAITEHAAECAVAAADATAAREEADRLRVE